MKKKIEIKEDSKSFGRFETLLTEVVKVPKDEILRREKEKKERKEKAKKT